VLVSIDLDELLKLADRIIVLFRGKLAYQAPRNRSSMDSIAGAWRARRARAPRITEREAGRRRRRGGAVVPPARPRRRATGSRSGCARSTRARGITVWSLLRVPRPWPRP
jgi:hypothetical protein